MAGRKGLLFWGHVGICIVHASVAIFNIENIDIGVLVMVAMFTVFYQTTSGPVAWIYATETTIDAGMGVCQLTLWSTVLFLSIVCPIIIDPKCLGPNITFFILCGISCVGAVYVLVFIKETKGMTDKEKKLIFTPEIYMTKTPHIEKKELETLMLSIDDEMMRSKSSSRKR